MDGTTKGKLMSTLESLKCMASLGVEKREEKKGFGVQGIACICFSVFLKDKVQFGT